MHTLCQSNSFKSARYTNSVVLAVNTRPMQMSLKAEVVGPWWLQKVGLGSAHLEEALCLLKDAGQPPVSPILEQEIQEALVDFKPDCTLEHLKVAIAAGSQATHNPASDHQSPIRTKCSAT